MTDDRDLIPADDHATDETPEDSIDQVEPVENEPIADMTIQTNEVPVEGDDDDYALLSSDALNDALEDLETYDSLPSDESDDDERDSEHDSEHDPTGPDDDEVEPSPPDDSGSDVLETIDEEERLRGPRAQSFRRRRRNRIAFLPLALYLIGIGIFLIAHEQDVENLPNPSTLEIGALSVLAGAFTMIFHSILFSRHERGLLVTGLWLGVTVGLTAALVAFVDDQPDATEWWPLLIGSIGVTLIINYLIEPTHDTRLVWVAVMGLLAAGIAYGFTSDLVAEDSFSTLADNWPLLVSVIGIGLVPLVFRRQTD